MPDARESDEPLGEVEPGALVGDEPDAHALDDTIHGVGDAAIGTTDERGLLDDVAETVEVPVTLLDSEERGLLDESHEPSAEDAGTWTLGTDGDASETVDDGGEGIDESFTVDETARERLDEEVDEGFDENRFAAPLAARAERRRADRQFVHVLHPEAGAPFSSGPPLAAEPEGCTASLAAFGVELCALYEPGSTLLACLRDGVVEILADIGDLDDDAGPVEHLRARKRDGVLEILVEGPFGARVFVERVR